MKIDNAELNSSTATNQSPGDNSTKVATTAYVDSAVAAPGYVVGPASSTDNALVRFDGATGKLVQNSSATLDDSGNLTITGTVDGRDIATDGTKLDSIESGADVTDATNVAAAGAVMDSDFSTAGLMVQTSAGNYTTRSIAGTANQINVALADGKNGNPTLSLDDDVVIAGVLSPGSLTVNGDLTVTVATILGTSTTINEVVSFSESGAQSIITAHDSSASNKDLQFDAKGTGGVFFNISNGGGGVGFADGAGSQYYSITNNGDTTCSFVCSGQGFYLDLLRTDITGSSVDNTMSTQAIITPSSGSTHQFFVNENKLSLDTTTAGSANGSDTDPYNVSVYGKVSASGTNNITSMTAGYFLSQAGMSSGTVTHNLGALSLAETTGNNTVTNNYGLRVQTQSSSGSTITNNYGIYIDDSHSGTVTNNFALYSNSSANSYIAGFLGVGTSSPTSSLQVSGDVDDTPDAAGVHMGLLSGAAQIELAGTNATRINAIDFTYAGVDIRGRIQYDLANEEFKFLTSTVTRATLNSTGLGVNMEPVKNLSVQQTGNASAFFCGNSGDFEGMSNNFFLGGKNVTALFANSGADGNAIAIIRNLQADLGSNSNQAPRFEFCATRSTLAQVVAGTYTACASGDNIGNIVWHADDGSDTRNAGAQIAGKIEGSVSTNITPTRLNISTQNSSGVLAFRMSILPDGKIGMGNNLTPTGKLHVDQEDSTAAIPVLKLDQGDVDESFIDFIGTSAATNANSLSSSTGTAANKVGAIRIEINGTTRWLRFYDDAT